MFVNQINVINYFWLCTYMKNFKSRINFYPVGSWPHSRGLLQGGCCCRVAATFDFCNNYATAVPAWPVQESGISMPHSRSWESPLHRCSPSMLSCEETARWSRCLFSSAWCPVGGQKTINGWEIGKFHIL